MRIVGITAIIVPLLLATSAQAQNKYPSRPITMIVAFSPGGGTDGAARLVAKDLAVELGQPVIVENRPGAGGAIGAQAVVRAPPDGYTLLFGSGSELDVMPAVKAEPPYNTQRDFEPISQIGTVSFLLAVNPSVKANTVQELIDLAKTSSERMTYGSYGVGSTNHLIAESFAHKTGARLLHVPYKGSAAAATDLLSGQVQIGFDTVSAMLPYVSDGKLRALAVLSSTRSTLAPDLPTMAESGVPDSIFEGSLGMLAPRNTPPQIVQQLYAAVSKVLKSPALIEALRQRGVTVVGSDPRQFGDFLKADIEKWTAIAHTAQIQVK